GENRYLMTAHNSSADLTGTEASPGVGVQADDGVTHVGMAAFAARTLQINDATSLAGVDLTVGSTTVMETFIGSDQSRRVFDMATGAVRLDGDTTVGNVVLESGRLLLGDGADDVFEIGSITVNSNDNIAALAFQRGASYSIAGDLTINAGGV